MQNTFRYLLNIFSAMGLIFIPPMLVLWAISQLGWSIRDIEWIGKILVLPGVLLVIKLAGKRHSPEKEWSLVVFGFGCIILTICGLWPLMLDYPESSWLKLFLVVCSIVLGFVAIRYIGKNVSRLE
jgi:FtsH-binding integral membrane protein